MEHHHDGAVVSAVQAADEFEDVDLVGRMRALGVTETATSRFPVLTSARLGGRAPAGFASYLMALLP